MIQIELYQYVLNKLSHGSIEYLQIVDDFLGDLNKKIEANRNAVMASTGSWADMKENDHF